MKVEVAVLGSLSLIVRTVSGRKAVFELELAVTEQLGPRHNLSHVRSVLCWGTSPLYSTLGQIFASITSWELVLCLKYIVEIFASNTFCAEFFAFSTF